jgi:alcohol dehydrogenase
MSETEAELLPPSRLAAGDFRMVTRLIYGPGCLQRLGQAAHDLGARRVLLVSDPGVCQAGHAQRGEQSLRASGLEVLLFAEAHENPTTEDVQRGVEAVGPFGPDLIVGLGGGSAMDCAKGINFLLTNGGRMQDYWGVDKATRPMLPLITVPTTAGTGSEMQSFALISDAETSVKMACGDKKTLSRVAILDPELTLTQPPMVTALTAIDALSHAIETFVSTKHNLISRMFSRESFRLLSGAMEPVLERPDDLATRTAMQMGACYAGLAIENSMLGAAHALANPLTARYGTPHGQAVGLMLPHVVQYNAELFEADYQDLMRSFSAPQSSRGGCGSHELRQWLDAVLQSAGLATRLADLDVPQEDIPDLAAAAAPQWTGTFNPRPVEASSLAELYRRAY